MSLVPYVNNPEADRFAHVAFSPELRQNWIRILPRPDRKAQVAEFHELQSLSNYIQQSNFSYIHDLYSIVQGLVVKYVETTESTHKFTLTPGQVYIEHSLVGAMFVDITENSFTIPSVLSETSYIGLEIKILDYDSAEYNDPITGAEVSGTLGSHRALVESSIVIRQESQSERDAYPIAYIQRSLSNIPKVVQYDNQRTDFTSTFRQSSRKLSFQLAALVAKRQQEEIGNFIVSGLNVTCDGVTAKVSPGCCYIQGYAVNVPFPLVQQLTRPAGNQLVRYVLSLNEFAALTIIFESDEQPLTPPQPSNTVYIGLITVGSNGVCVVVDSENRIPTVADLEEINKQHEANSLATLELATQSGLLSPDSSYNGGLFAPSLINLRDSDTSHPLYNAAIMPAVGSVRPGYLSQIVSAKINSNLSTNSLYVNKDDRDSKTIYSSTSENNVRPDYVSTTYSEVSALIQPDATTWVELLNPIKTTAIMILSSSASIADVTKKPTLSALEPSRKSNQRLWASQTQTNQNPYDSIRFAGASSNLITPSQLPNISSFILRQVSEPTPLKTTINFTNLLKTVNLIVKCYGFNKDEDNLILSFAYSQISIFTIIKGTVGSTLGTVKADNGVVVLSFNLPQQMPSGEHIITLANDRISAKAIYTSTSAIEFRYNNDFDNYTDPSPVAFFCNNYARA